QIRDPKVQAILLGKLGKASEKKVHFVIDSNSSLMLLPPHFKISQLITIAGNLIDNAFEEVANQRERDVSFFITDMGNDIVMEVADNGRGISNDQIDKLFNKGFSTKGENRGYGLANVKEEVDSLGGYIEVNNPKTGGTVFTVILPKASQIQREEER
ncbi:MAG TPA: ATP-binding protein, partial [Chondromyces sp.]|nr:ATP-binding protein [Chondromyces sp.]